MDRHTGGFVGGRIAKIQCQSQFQAVRSLYQIKQDASARGWVTGPHVPKLCVVRGNGQAILQYITHQQQAKGEKAFDFLYEDEDETEREEREERED